MLLQDTHSRFKDTNMLKVKGWKKDTYHANSYRKKAGVATLISDKIYTKIKSCY